MRPILIITLLFISFNIKAQEYQKMIESGEYTLTKIKEEADKYFTEVGKGKGTGYKQFKRWEYQTKREINENSYLKNSEEKFETFNRFRLQQAKFRSLSTTATWQEIGPDYYTTSPTNGARVGRVTSVAIDHNDNNHMIVGAHTGGVWKTTDGGQNWIPLTDEMASSHVYAVAIDPQNSSIYYWGSNWGGLFKSNDAGESWTRLPQTGYFDINRILIDPTNSNTVFVSNSYSGVFKSTNGGISFTQVSSMRQVYDIEFKPGDPNTVYISGRSFEKSIDGGNTFREISGFGTGVKMIGVSPDDPSRVYVIETNYSKSFNGFYRSNNAGESFAKLDHGTKNYFGRSTIAEGSGGQAPRDMAIAVNPSDADEVHIAGIAVWRSMNAGLDFSLTGAALSYQASFNNVGYCHADVDIMVYQGDTLYIGTDGGIFYSAKPSENIHRDYFTDISVGLGIRQFYKLGVSQSDPVVVATGSQDNGSSVWSSDVDEWYDWLSADGMEAIVDWSNPDHIYGTRQRGQIFESQNRGRSDSRRVTIPYGTASWVAPFEQDPINANTIYLGQNKVYKKVGNGDWIAISQTFNRDLDHIKIAPSNNHIIYAAFDNQLYKTSTGGGIWTNISGIPGNINAIAIHPYNPNKVAIAVSGTSNVLITENGGQNWVSYKKNLPLLNPYTLVWDKEDNNGLYLGMDYGIYYINDELTEWILYSNGMPNVKISELEINYPTNKIYAATYGRGVWASTLYGIDDVTTAIDINHNSSEEEFVTVHPNPTSDYISISLRKEEQFSWTICSADGTIINYGQEHDSKTKRVNLSNYSSGTYFIIINTNTQNIVRKLIKE